MLERDSLWGRNIRAKFGTDGLDLLQGVILSCMVFSVEKDLHVEKILSCGMMVA